MGGTFLYELKIIPPINPFFVELLGENLGAVDPIRGLAWALSFYKI